MQVPSFDNKVAMTMIQQELGRPWQEVYSQLTPRPIAAASLGQVCLKFCTLDAFPPHKCISVVDQGLFVLPVARVI